jgi:CRP-like cAMP-binding protein
MQASDFLQSIIAACSRYEQIPAEAWFELAPLVRFRALEKGDSFVRAGDVPQELAFIVAGGVRHCHTDEQGVTRITDFCLPGEFTGALELYAEPARPAEQGIEAFTQTNLAVLDKSALEDFIAARPAFQSLFRKIVIDYLQIRTRRETDLLCADLALRYENFLRLYPGLPALLPQYEIASFLNMTPETLSRIRARRAHNA